jgi:feruloyl esterase
VSEASYIPPAKYALIHNAVLQKCDARDGLKDGVIEDPARCRDFDPGELLCKGQDSVSCLTAPQVEAARAIYGPVVNRRTKEAIAPGFERGSEPGWATMAGPRMFGIGADMFRYVVFPGADWDFKTFNFDSDVTATLKAEGGILNAMDTNLKPYFDRGGKLIQYHGWNDPQIAPQTSVDYYEGVSKVLGAAVSDSYRLFMVPGMAHCGGGDGVSTFDMVTELDRWVQSGKAPNRIEASRVREGKVDRTRPLCPWPQRAVYKGSGSADDAGNFSCGAP